MSSGHLVLVLHAHVPHVLHHGRRPHGEVWLMEAAAESWLPLLDTLARCRDAGLACPLTLGLSPVLLEQLASARFKEGLPRYLAEQEGRAHADEIAFMEDGAHELAALARAWADRLLGLAEAFDALDRDLPRAFAALAEAGHIELLSSCATHAHLPLLLHDASCRAQLRLGLDTSERLLGLRPEGLWLPECALRPSGTWTPHAVFDQPRHRAGTDELLAELGVRYTFVDAPLLRGARSEGVLTPGGFVEVGWDQAGGGDGRAWRSPLEPHVASSRGDGQGVAVLARHPELVEQVLSPTVGYPADGRYLEFHKRMGEGGLRYWRVTSLRSGLEGKARYEPEAAAEAVRSHAQAFAANLRSVLRRHHALTGRPGLAVVPFRAELFGHSWFEGPAFLEQLMRALAEDEAVRPLTAGAALHARPPDKVVRLPEGSWAEGGGHGPVLSPRCQWMWEVLYHAEERFGQLSLTSPWREDAALRADLELAGRELLLMQSSDWAQAVGAGPASDYGARRFAGHALRFDRACEAVEERMEGRPPDAALAIALDEARASDALFEGLRLDAWGEPRRSAP